MHNIGQKITQNKAFFGQFSEFEPINFTLRTNTKIYVFEHKNCSSDFTESEARCSYKHCSYKKKECIVALKGGCKNCPYVQFVVGDLDELKPLLMHCNADSSNLHLCNCCWYGTVY